MPEVTVGISAAPLALTEAKRSLEERGPLPFDLVPSSSEMGLEAAGDSALFHLDYPPVPDGWAAYPLGWEGIAIIVHRGVTMRAFSLDQLEEIFTGRIEDWSQLGGEEGAIQLVVPPTGDRLRAHFVEWVLPSGRITTRALLAPSPADAVELVASEPGAIGLVPLHQATEERVAYARVEGVLPGPSTVTGGAYRLRLPVLALAPEELELVAYEWLIWVQSTSKALPTAVEAPASTAEPSPAAQ